MSNLTCADLLRRFLALRPAPARSPPAAFRRGHLNPSRGHIDHRAQTGAQTEPALRRAPRAPPEGWPRRRRPRAPRRRPRRRDPSRRGTRPAGAGSTRPVPATQRLFRHAQLVPRQPLRVRHRVGTRRTPAPACVRPAAPDVTVSGSHHSRDPGPHDRPDCEPLLDEVGLGVHHHIAAQPVRPGHPPDQHHRVPGCRRRRSRVPRPPEAEPPSPECRAARASPCLFGRQRHQRAQRRGRPALTPDDLPHVARRGRTARPP